MKGTTEPFNGMTHEEIYLDWVNNFVTLDYMAEHYGVKRLFLQQILKTGKEQHESKFGKFAVTIYRPERISYEQIKDVAYTKIFNNSTTMKEVLEWGSRILSKADEGKTFASIIDLHFSNIVK